MARTPPPRSETDDFAAAQRRADNARIEPIIWALVYAGAMSAGYTDRATGHADRGLAAYRERFVNDPEAQSEGEDA